MKRRSVAFVLPSGDLASTGGEKNHLQLIRSLDRSRFEVLAVSRPGPGAEQLANDGVTTAVLPKLAPVGLRGYLRYFRQALRLRRALQDLDHHQGPSLQGAAEIVRALERAPMKTLAPPGKAHRGRLLSERFGIPLHISLAEDLLLALHALRLKRAVLSLGAEICVTDLPWDALAAVVGLHDTPVRLVWYIQTSNKHHLGELLLPRHVHRVIACGEGVARARLGEGHRAVVVPNGIRTDCFRPLPPGAPRPPEISGIPPDNSFVVGAVGDLTRSKGTLDLMRAVLDLMRERPGLHLVLLGRGGPLFESALRARIWCSGLRRRVHLSGYVEDLSRVLPHFQLFVLPSHAEGLPLVLCEAMASGVPCIATDIPGCQEVAEDGAAVLVPVGDPGALGRAIARQMDDPEFRSNLARRGRQRVCSAFTFTRMLRGFEAALEEV